MKLIKIESILVALFLAGFFLTRCSDDPAPAPQNTSNYSISGTVNYPDFDGNMVSAAGAVVYLAANTTSPTTNYDVSVIANSSGSYSFSNLEAGNYFLFSNFNTENTNIPSGRIQGINFSSGDGNLITITDASVTQNLELGAMTSASGTAVVDTEADNSFDFSHSTLEFSFPFDGENATFTGDFSTYDIEVVFDEANPASTTIVATVDLTSIFTGQPGRDDKGKCINGTLGVQYDPADTLTNGDVDPVAIPINDTGTATFTSTSCAVYGDGYLAKGNMTLNGFTSEVDLFFTYIPGFEGTTSSGQLRQYSSFQGQLKFAALDDFGLDSSHILGATVTVDISVQIRKNL